MNLNNKIGLLTASSVVVANMIGTGVFTSLGYQAAGFQAIFPLLMLWVIGGIVALCGALSYGELAAMMPRSGGEYHFLSKIYHPAFGFLSGWASATVGFAAPVALAVMALARYVVSVFPVMDQTLFQFGFISLTGAKLLAIFIVLALTAVHSSDVAVGGLFQRYSTGIKVALILIFIFSGLFLIETPQNISILPQTGDFDTIMSAGFAVSLAFVSFAYAGWNAAAYLANEIHEPQKNVPKAILLGTLTVTGLYVLLTFVFLYTVPVGTLASMQAQDFGKPLEVGYLAADNIFGAVGGKMMAIMIALLLVSSISAMIFAGPRVTQVMGEDFELLQRLAKTNSKGVPQRAMILQTIITLVLIITTAFDTVLYYIAFTLDIFTFSTVLGVFVMRFKKPDLPRSYKAWGYPITPLIFLAATGWTMYFLLTERTQGSLIALGTVLLGLIFYFWDRGTRKNS